MNIPSLNGNVEIFQAKTQNSLNMFFFEFAEILNGILVISYFVLFLVLEAIHAIFSISCPFVFFYLLSICKFCFLCYSGLDGILVISCF